MKKDPNLTQQEFDDLLNWLAPDRDAAGELYLQLSEGLNRLFRLKGCSDTQTLVDATFNRVAKKLDSIDTSAGYQPITFFYGFARNIFFEHVKKETKVPIKLEPSIFKNFDDLIGENDSEVELNLECLDGCVDGLDNDESMLVIGYFEYALGEKLASRRRLAKKLNISLGNLRVRIHRIKGILRDCLETCLQNN